MMFGYATNETENSCHWIWSHKLLQELAILRRENKQIYLRPDAKSQVTLEYSDDNKPTRIDAIVIRLNMMILMKNQLCLLKLKKT
jgi:S-adenosylmethionine synthetase